MAVAGIVEMAVDALCVLGKDGLLLAQALLLFSGGLILYRAMDWHSEAKEPCSCFDELLNEISLSILGLATIVGLEEVWALKIGDVCL